MDIINQLTSEVPTLNGILSRACRKYGENTLATFDGESVTYRDAWDRAGALANALAKRGIEKGDRVGLMMSNQLGYVTADLACVRGGYAKVAMNDMLTEDEFEYMLSDSRAGTVVCGPEFVETVAEGRETDPATLREFFDVTDRELREGPSRAAPTFIRESRRAQRDRPPVADDAVVFCTLADSVVSTRAIGEAVPPGRTVLYDGGHELFASPSRKNQVDTLLAAVDAGAEALDG